MAFAHFFVDSQEQKVLFLTGVARKQSDATWEVLTDDGKLIKAVLSADLIVHPRAGSKVLMLCSFERYYILHILTLAASTVKIQANTIELMSQNLLLQNQRTEINTKELKMTAHSILTTAKRMYQEIGMLFQKARSCFFENRHHKIRAETLTEEVKQLHFQKAGVIAQQADVISTQADKVLIN